MLGEGGVFSIWYLERGNKKKNTPHFLHWSYFLVTPTKTKQLEDGHVKVSLSLPGF